jgi:hypothetical protein
MGNQDRINWFFEIVFCSILLALVFWGMSDLWKSSEIPPEPDDQLSESVQDGWQGAPRSPEWANVRKEHVLQFPRCAACGTVENLNVHHILPFHEHPELELDQNNLITLCREHHFRIGHDPDGPGPKKPNWKASNPKVRQHADQFFQSQRKRAG